MKFACDQCGTRYSIADEKVEGKILKIRCKVCDFTMVVRGSDQRTGGSLHSMASVASNALPSHQEIEWYAAIGHRQVGPIPLERLEEMFRSGDLGEDSLVWNETMDDWTLATGVAEVAHFFRSPEKAKPPPLPAEPPAVPAGEDDMSPGSQSLEDVAPIPALVQNEVAFTSAAPISDADTEHVEAPTEVDSLASLLGQAPEFVGRPTEKMLPEVDDSIPPSGQEPRPQDIDTENRLEFLEPASLSEQASMEDVSSSPDGTQAYPPYPKEEFQDEDTALLDLDALVDRATAPEDIQTASNQASAPRDVSTRRIERESETESGVSEVGEPKSDTSPESQSSIIIAATELSEPPVSLPQISDEAVPELSAEPVAIEPDEPGMHGLDLERVSPRKNEESDVERSSAKRAVIQPDSPVGRALSQNSVATKRGESSRPSVSTGLVVMACIMGMAVMGLVVHFVTKDDQEVVASQTPPAQPPAIPETTQPKNQDETPEQTPQPPVNSTLSLAKETPQPLPLAVDASAPKMEPQQIPSVESQVVQAPDPVVTKESQGPVGGLGPPTGRSKVEAAQPKKISKPKKKVRKKTKPEPEFDALNLERKIVLKAPSTSNTTPGRRSSSLRSRMSDSERDSPARLKDIGSSSDLQTSRNRPRTTRTRGPESQLPSRRTASGSARGSRVDKGPIKQEDINRVVKDHKKALNGCYERHLKKDPEYNPGKVKLEFTIRPTGRTEAVSIGKQHANTIMKRCLDRLVRRWKFPTFKGQPYKASVPLVFRQNF